MVEQSAKGDLTWKLMRASGGKKSDFIEFLLGSVMTILILVVVIYEYKIDSVWNVCCKNKR